MHSISSLRRQACWTLIALVALSLLPACLSAQSYEYRPVLTDADAAKVSERCEGVIVYPAVTVAGAQLLAKLKLKAVCVYPDDSKFEVSGGVVRELLKCPTLENVSVRNFAGLFDHDFAGLADLQHLNVLELRALPGITAETITYAARPRTLAYLTLVECQKVGPAALDCIANMPLAGLTLEGKQFSLCGMLFTGSANLSYLDLQAIAAVDDAFLCGLARFPLANVSITSTPGSLPGVSDAGLFALAGIGTLEGLSIDGVGNISDRALQRLGAMTRLSHLSLTAGKAPSVLLTSGGVNALLRSNSLVSLSLGGQNKISWAIGKNFGAGGSIQNIDLSATSIDDANLKLVAERLVKANVKSVDTTGCGNVSEAGRLIANRINNCIDANGLDCGVRQ
ncbi:MAG: hypothetical protein IT462_13040 [Planctomycetes bacterium]|nr:hypothetical protein [Planctomycetota bacterium]